MPRVRRRGAEVSSRWTSRVAVVSLLFAGALSTGAAAPSLETIHASGIEILSGEVKADPPLDEALADEWHYAYRLSELNPDDLSYPWVDPTAGVVEYTTVTSRGSALVADHLAQAESAVAASIRSATVRHSRAELQSIMDAEIGPTSEGIVIRASYPDPKNNRIIVEVEDYSDQMLWRLAKTHGTDAIAVRVLGELPDTYPAARNSDTPHFYGGAWTNNCTTGFSWESGSVEMMVMAGHCNPTGGSQYTPSCFIGSVTSGSEENWNSGVGTVVRTGGSGYHGDIALVRATGTSCGVTNGTNPSIWIGGTTSVSAATVKQMWSRSPANGDQFCTGGSRKGEVCGWTTDWSAAGNYYYNGTGETARTVWRGTKHGHCIAAGDSGGPVYTVRGDGGIAAKGIISGAAGYGGDDAFTGALEPACQAVYTDIWQVYYYFPGVLQTL